MPIEMPVAIAARVPPSSRARLTPSRSASSVHAPISTAAFAIGWPRMARRSIPSSVRGWLTPAASTRGAIHSVMACQAVSTVSAE